MSIFYVKNCPNLSNFFFTEKYQFRGMFFVIDISWKLELLKHFVYKNHVHFSLDEFRADIDLPKFFFYKSAIFHPIQLPFDAEAAEKFLKVI